VLFRASLVLLLALSLAPSLFGQPVAGSITTHALPFAGPPFEPVSSFFEGGFNFPAGTGVYHTSVIDAAGNVYNTGDVSGPAGTIVTPGAAQTEPGGGACLALFGTQPCPDVYIAKADASGNLVFGTLLGGPTIDIGTALAVDAAGNVFVAGTTGGSFPTTANAAIPASTTNTTFAAMLSADGSRFVYVTYLPDTAATATAIAVDSQGNAYVAGQTKTGHAYIAKLNPGGSAFLYYVQLAGSNQESAASILADSSGNLLVAGETSSPDFPVTPGAVQARLAGVQNLFVTKLDANGGIVFSTYLGGSGADTPNALQTDAAGNIYVAGSTTSFDFPATSGAFQPAPIVPLWNNQAPGGFIASLSSSAGTLIYASYVMSVDSMFFTPYLGVTSLAVTPAGEAYLAGATGAGFPVTESAPQICFNGPTDAFVAHLDPHGGLADATYLAGALYEFEQGLTVANDGSILLQSWSYGNSTIASIRFGASGWTAPACLSPNPSNAATMYSAGSLAPGEFLSLTGFGIGPATGVAYTPDAQGQPPLELAGVEVFFDGQAAPLLYVQSRQINVLAPFGLTPGESTTIQVAYNGSPVDSVTAPVSSTAPGIFRRNLGVSSQAAAVNQDGTINGPSNPAPPGSIVSIWGTGFGSIDPPCATGGFNPFAAVNLVLSVTLEDIVDGGFAARENPAVYAGSAPGMLCGVDQINMWVPTYASGTYLFFPLEANGGGAGVTIAVQ
jgi:uncharacterized protein (TIGR03437 family)